MIVTVTDYVIAGIAKELLSADDNLMETQCQEVEVLVLL